MQDTEIRKNIYDLLKNMVETGHNLSPLKQLFWSELNYNRVNEQLPRRNWSDKLQNAIADDPILFAEYKDFHIIYSRLNSDKLRIGSERPIINQLIKDHSLALFIFSDLDQKNWHFVNVKYDDLSGRRTRRRIMRRIAIGPNERLRTATERISMLDIESISSDLFSISALAIQERHDQAFDVEAVTKEFFENYKIVFRDIEKQLLKQLLKQINDETWAHDYSLLLLNRLMFLYFVQRKRWINDDPEFIVNYWKAYKESNQPKDSFFSKWLNVLFFEAFNNNFKSGMSDRQHIPEKIRSALSKAPYLNGGLFSKKELDEKYNFNIPDSVFVELFDRYTDFHNRTSTPGFLEAYNFTIREDSPFDQEVAVDPEMLGKVYESLINVTSLDSDETDQRGSAGIFYTPRIEIDMMCRISLVDWLANNLGDKYKPLLYEAIFAYDPEEIQTADERIASENLSQRLYDLLKEITVLDPACGSGSFLVGMLNVLDGLQQRLQKQLGINETTYERMKRIIGQNLYGVDVMDWAVHVAELRMWLQLIIETQLDWHEMKFEPLLPNLSFKIRQGDSLVQEVGGINFALHRHHLDISKDLKAKLNKLKNEKLEFYNSTQDSKRAEQSLKTEESLLFKDILFARKLDLEKEIKKLTNQIESPPEQLTFQGISKPEAVQLDFQVEKWKQERDKLQQELKIVVDYYDAFTKTEQLPFIWDLAYVEIFEGDKKGFDIVIGNPPYVRQEKIAPYDKKESDYTAERWREIKKEYKDKLQKSISKIYPNFFKNGIDNKSDLYIYFYLHGLSLLNDKGSFCFITSNSWLDVGYGKDLQEFLIKNCRIKMIIDNQAKRSFAQADVNTIIALLSTPNVGTENVLSNIAKFVVFKVPFEDILSPIIFEDIEETTERKSIPEGRIYPINQNQLLLEGTDFLEDNDGLIIKSIYTGNKWGGKYLRAPDIYFKILEKGKGKIYKLSDLARIKAGIITGNNKKYYKRREEFFDHQEYSLIFKSPKEVTKIAIYSKDAISVIKTKDIPFKIRKAKLLWVDLRGDKHLCHYNVNDLPFEHNFYGIDSIKEENNIFLCCVLNSTLTYFFVELLGRKGLGGGAIRLVKTDLINFPTLKLKDDSGLSKKLLEIFNHISERKILSVFGELGLQEIDDLQKINPDDISLDKVLPDRRELDRIVCEALGLDENDQLEIYKAVVSLVKNRLSKASSV